jgi:hypothetical protein
VAHAVGARGDLDEGAEVLGGDDLAVVDGAGLDLFADGGDLGLGVLDLEAVGAGDDDGAVVLDVDADAVLVLEGADGLAARADELADLLGVDVEGDECAGRRRRCRRAARR